MSEILLQISGACAAVMEKLSTLGGSTLVAHSPYLDGLLMVCCILFNNFIAISQIFL